MLPCSQNERIGLLRDRAAPLPYPEKRLTKKNYNPFPSVYYVYTHRCCSGSGEILYVGHGTNERAWAINSRSEAHRNHLNDMIFEGFTPDEWVTIVEKGLTKTEACRLERTLINEHRPSFNKIQGAKLLKVTPELLEEAFNLRELGYSYQKIAETLNISPMTIHRGMNKRIPALEAIRAKQ